MAAIPHGASFDLGMYGVKVFSATMAADRARLGDRITDWLANHPQVTIINLFVTQSSDMSFHCLTFTIYYYDPNAA